MGDDYLQQQAQNFRKGRDLARDEMTRPKLFDRDDLMSTVYPARPVGDAKLKPGDILSAHAPKGGQHIDLADGHRRVAIVEDDDAADLLAALREPDSSGVTRMRILSVSTVSGIAKASLIEEG